ncbi:MAG: S-methyl-5-thioribose-1-phosphate isomerase [bacterium]
MSFFTIDWRDNKVVMIDQRYLPEKEIYNEYQTYDEVAEAIEVMVIRGAPAIGIAAAMGMALAARQGAQTGSKDKLRETMQKAHDRLYRTRPTAVNLAWALERMKKLAEGMEGASPDEIAKACEEESGKVLKEDIEINRRMGFNGAACLKDGDNVLTHCNAGALATGGYGTALGVIRAAVEQGKNIHVYADETRPFLQGARLTTWELMKDNIPVTLITDNMAGHLMKKGKIQKVVTGADRVAANGDAANKIGTYSVAVLAERHNVPFYVAAPLSTIDLKTGSGDDIPIEERTPYEVTHVLGKQVVPDNCRVAHPAFDVTPANLIHALFTEAGVAEPPGLETIAALFKK